MYMAVHALDSDFVMAMRVCPEAYWRDGLIVKT
jgi:hypothetical protein